jgi:superfamily II DNA or RNA helicase/REP element-mobilizing transposase RayT
MGDVQLSDQFFQKTAGWEAVKQARSLVERGAVLSSNWTPPLLKGVVQEGGSSYRAGLVIKDETDVENICSCRQSREWGTICAHSVGVGIHHLKQLKPAIEQAGRGAGAKPAPTTATEKRGPKLKRGENGETVELFFMLPPNLGPALERGRVMLCVEAKWARGRGPINGLPLATTWAFSAEDLAPLETLEEITRGEPPGMIQLTAAELAKVLERLKGHPRVAIGRSTELEVSEEPYRLKLMVTLEADGQIVVGRASLPGQSVFVSGGSEAKEGNLPGRDARPTGASWVFAANRFQPVVLPQAVAEVFQKPVVVLRARVPMFLMQDWPVLASGCEVEANFTPQDFQFDPQPPKFLLHLAGGMAQLTAQLQCAYGPRIMTVGASDPNESLWLADPQNMKRYSTRDLAAEHAALTRLTKYGFRPGKTAGTYELVGQNQVLTFFAREHPKLEKEWKVTLEERLEFSANKNLERIEPKFQITPSGVQWFDLDVSFGTKTGETFSQADIQRLLLGGQSHTRLKNGKFALIDTGAVEELQEVLLDCNPQQTGAGYRMQATQAGFLESTLAENGWQAAAPTAWKERAKTLAGETTLTCPPLGKLEDVLRPYQKHGVGWMHFLRSNGFGGILADEMGLGKTLQALAFLSSIGRASVPGELPSSGKAVPIKTGTDLPGRDARPTGGGTPFMEFDRTAPVARHTRHLPHWEQAGATYFVTFRLGDSIGRERVDRWHRERRDWLAKNPVPHSPEQEADYAERFTDRFEEWLNAGQGECLLRRPEVADIVEDSLRHFDGERYQLGAYVVMPNHVHVLVKPLGGMKLEQLLHSWKSFTSSRINQHIDRSGPLWQEEYFDHLVRTGVHLQKYSDYIWENPEKAGLKTGSFRLGMGTGGAVGRASVPGELERGVGEVSKKKNTDLPGRDARPTGRRPHLVVCPTSLVFNWAAEAARFTPELKVVALHGPDRHKRFAEIPGADLVVTSYALVRRDADRYKAMEFDTVVLDEAQHIKNRQTQNAQAVKAIRSQHRLVLTGTPLENSVLDLWSIFDFLMPGYLGTAQDFRDRYEQPITKTKDADAQARLARRLKPFLLRRLKREVASELPDKLEQVSFCDLSDEQAQVYKQVLDATRREVVMAVDQNGLAKSRMVVLSALLRLRQICCDLRLLKLEEPIGRAPLSGESQAAEEGNFNAPGRDARPTAPAPSGKLEMFSELLEEVVDGEHRVLVFSQFVGMLTLLRERLETDGIEYCYLDGSTKDRGQAVQEFQRGKAPVFLISLKAGGVGLNLTGADTVIHFDPWWNPAVEDQATDRAHRIGQTRVVTSYKLITRGTIEEKILQLQQKKRDIIAATLTGEEALTGSLNWEEIQDLLA